MATYDLLEVVKAASASENRLVALEGKTSPITHDPAGDMTFHKTVGTFVFRGAGDNIAQLSTDGNVVSRWNSNGDIYGSIWGDWLSNWLRANCTSPIESLTTRANGHDQDVRNLSADNSARYNEIYTGLNYAHFVNNYGSLWGYLYNRIGCLGINAPNGVITVEASADPRLEFHIPAVIARMWHMTSDGTLHWAASNGAGGHVSSIMRIGASGNMVINGEFEATGNVIAYSDRRLKDNIKKTSGLDAIGFLEGVQWTWKEGHANEGKAGSGLIAQDVQMVAPEAVSVNEDGILGLNYNAVIGLLVNAVNELKAQVDELKEKLNER